MKRSAPLPSAKEIQAVMESEDTSLDEPFPKRPKLKETPVAHLDEEDNQMLQDAFREQEDIVRMLKACYRQYLFDQAEAIRSFPAQHYYALGEALIKINRNHWDQVFRREASLNDYGWSCYLSADM